MKLYEHLGIIKTVEKEPFIIIQEDMQKKSTRVRGVNYEGSVDMIEDQLQCELVQFKLGHVYKFQIDSETIKKEFNRYLVIKKLHELFEELTTNHNAEVTNSSLLIPLSVQYRGRAQTLLVQLPLEKQNIHNTELNQIYLREIAQISKENAEGAMYREKQIKFRCDEMNLSIKNFEVTNKNVVRYTGNNTHAIVNHFEPLSKVGVYYFQAKIIKTYSKNLIFGVCTHDVKSLLNIYQSAQFIGLNLSERTILNNSKTDIAISHVEIVEGRSIVRVEIDMNKGVISWYLDGGFLCARKLPREIAVKQVLPMISFCNADDTVELLDE